MTLRIERYSGLEDIGVLTQRYFILQAPAMTTCSLEAGSIAS
jgi:hypothetical protein